MGERSVIGMRKVGERSSGVPIRHLCPTYTGVKAGHRCVKGGGKELWGTYQAPMPHLYRGKGRSKVCERWGKGALGYLSGTYTPPIPG
ncbi:hypothetical protein A8L44_15285 [Bacillus sp. FJAT-27986]|nr:hypothetical protein A8L44_15285 [Bacillus sp. FJAT-27986]